MIGYGMHTTILTLWKQGKSKKEIARITQKDRKTVRKVIKKYEETGIETHSTFNNIERQLTLPVGDNYGCRL